MRLSKDSIMRKHFAHQNVIELKDHKIFIKLIGACFLLVRSSSSAASTLLKSEDIK